MTQRCSHQQVNLTVYIASVWNVQVCIYRKPLHLCWKRCWCRRCNIMTEPINAYWSFVCNPIHIAYELRVTAIAGDENCNYGEEQGFATRRCVFFFFFLTLTRRERRGRCELVTVKLPLRHCSLPPLLPPHPISVSNSSCAAFSSLASRLHLQPLPPLIVARDYDRAQLSCFTASHESYLKCHWSRRRTAAFVPAIAQHQTKWFWPVWLLVVPHGVFFGQIRHNKTKDAHACLIPAGHGILSRIFTDARIVIGSGSEAVVKVALDFNWFTIWFFPKWDDFRGKCCPGWLIGWCSTSGSITKHSVAETVAMQG